MHINLTQNGAWDLVSTTEGNAS